MISHVYFDYGGVIAEEGFAQGLRAIAVAEGRDPDEFFTAVRDIIFETGYVVGRVGEDEFWKTVRDRLGVRQDPQTMRREILSRFALRPHMLHLARRLRSMGRTVAILSDQTNWLDELDARDGFFSVYDHVFNSFHHGVHKGQREFFDLALSTLGARPANALFIDDQEVNIVTARAVGLDTVHFTSPEAFATGFGVRFPGLLQIAHDDARADTARP